MARLTFVVTGASRGIGGHLTRALLARGHRVFGVARSDNSADFAQERADGLYVPIVGDVTDRRTLDRSLKALNGIEAISGLALNAGYDLIVLDRVTKLHMGRESKPISTLASTKLNELQQY